MSGTYPPARVGWYAVVVLLLAYTFSFIDRIILTLMVAPIRRDLIITDTQISLLHGFAFAIFYTVLGLPLARLADRSSRRRLVIVGIVIWSVMTAACGFARNFAQLFLTRVGVGIGEASLSPAAYSMIGDLFAPASRGRAIALYTSGITVGSGAALLLGGVVVQAASAGGSGLFLALGLTQAWQVIFVLVGLPGLLIALLMLTVAEPVRQAHAPVAHVPLRMVFAAFGRTPAIWGHFLGFGLASLVFNGFFAWAPTLFVRQFAMTPGAAALQLGLAMLVGGTLGMLGGGALADRWTARGRSDATMRVGLLACIGLIPFAIAVPLAPSASVAFALFWPFFFFVSMPFGVAPAALAAVSPPGVKAQMIALYLLAINLFGIGAGPLVIAMVTDYGFGADAAIGKSMAVVGAIAAPAAAIVLALALKPYRAARAQFADEMA